MATTSGPAPLRATDADRAAVLDALDTAHDSGQLDRVEHYERVRAATAARHLDDLRPLVADLQGKVRLPAGRTPARRTNTSSSSPHRTTPLSAEQIRDIEVPTQWSTRKSVGVAAVVLAGALGLFLALAPLSDDTRPIDDPGESVIARPAPAGDEGPGATTARPASSTPPRRSRRRASPASATPHPTPPAPRWPPTSWCTPSTRSSPGPTWSTPAASSA